MDSRQEIEAKFNVADLSEIRRRLKNQDGRVIAPKHQEHNLYFDTPDRQLRNGKQILRIRTGSKIILTYKQQGDSIETRTEIELALDNATEAQALLEGLGYVPILSYSKRRETFGLGDTSVVLDELPFGLFVEIEGPSLDRVRDTSERLGLDWKKRSTMGYMALFEKARELLNIPAQEITFDRLIRDHPLQPPDLGLADATLIAGPSEMA
jgi:adenylate cyclase class 2